MNYVHGDVKPLNFLVDSDEILKLSDFDFSVKINNPLNLDFLEGDSRYYAPELLDNTLFKQILSFSTDIFSLGLSFTEIIFKIDLPVNGPLWEEMRKEGFEFKDEFYRNSDLDRIDTNMIKMIKWMLTINPINRPTTSQLLQSVPELQERRYRQMKGEYNNKRYKGGN